MAMTVKLFKNSMVDGITRLGLWDTKASQVAYFDTLESKNYNLVNTLRLGENLRVNDRISNLLNYSYGYIDYGDGFRYYFSVGNLIMVTETITEISYTLDCYDTAITQLDNWAMKRAIVTRYPEKQPLVRVPYDPDYYVSQIRSSLRASTLVALAYDKSGNPVTILANDNPNNLITGFWMVNQQTYTPTDIVACGIITSYYTKSEVENTLTGYSFLYTEDSTDHYIAEKLGFDANLKTKMTLLSKGSKLTNDGFEWDEIRDVRGNVIYQCPLGAELTLEDGYVSLSATSVNEVFNFSDGITDEKIRVVLPAEIPVIRSDEFAEYRKRGRAIDIETRNMQINQNFLSGLFNIGGNAISGMMGGGMSGMSASAGAFLGAGTGALGAIGNYAISSFYAPSEQNLIDKKYANANHALLNYGSASIDMFQLAYGGVRHVKWDPASIDRYQNDVYENGYYVWFATDDFNGSLKRGAITADIEIIGDLPQAWKEQIHDRFLNGVKMV